jgi:hypothetical protein
LKKGKFRIAPRWLKSNAALFSIKKERLCDAAARLGDTGIALSNR